MASAGCVCGLHTVVSNSPLDTERAAGNACVCVGVCERQGVWGSHILLQLAWKRTNEPSQQMISSGWGYGQNGESLPVFGAQCAQQTHTFWSLF